MVSRWGKYSRHRHQTCSSSESRQWNNPSERHDHNKLLLNIRCCATKYLQMAAGDKFSRADPTRTLFLSAVNCVCSPFSPTLYMSGSQLTLSITKSHCLTTKPVKPHEGRKSILGGRHKGYDLGYFVASSVFLSTLLHTYRKEDTRPK